MAWWKCKNDFKSYIDVYGIANAIVTATTGSKSYTATANAQGYARIKVKKKGSYSVTSNSTLRVAYATIVDKTPVTALYRWNKYNSVAYYAKTTSTIAANSYLWESSSTSAYTGVTMYCQASSYGFNSSNGMYTLSGYTTKIGPAFRATSVKIAKGYFMQPGKGYSHTQMAALLPSDDSYSYMALGSNSVRFSNISGTMYNSGIGGYNKGSTSYGTVTSSNINAYPTNGRYSTDGYWYVAA